MDAVSLIAKLKKEKPGTFRYSISRIKDEMFVQSVLEHTGFLHTEAPHLQRLWHLTNEVYNVPVCPICGKENVFKDSSSGYTKFCSGSCEIKNKWLKTTPAQKQEIYKKQKTTNLERYGDECTFRVDSIKEKMKKTLQKNYGEHVTNPTQSKEINDRVKKSIKERYGVENPGQTPQAIQTRIDRYGSDCVFKSEEIQEKIKKTNLERYGAENYLASEEGKEKTMESCIKRYDVKHPMQNPEIFERAIRPRSYKYEASNGKTYTLQGYERFALEELLGKYEEADIIHGTSNIRKYVKFDYVFNGTNRNYFPDFYIVSENLIVEVKSTFTLECEKDKNSLKRQAVLDKNVRFEFWVYDNSGKKINVD